MTLFACSKETHPVIVGGDYFNIIRNPHEKNSDNYNKDALQNDNYNDRWPFLFNAFMDGLDLSELELSNRKFTCT